MLRTETQESLDFYALSALQIGWEFDVTQLTRADQASSATLIQSKWVSLVPMKLNASFDQTLVARPGYVNFGIPAVSSTPIWVGGQPVAADKLVLFPTAEQGSSASTTGFSATAIHLQQSQLERLLQVLFHRTLDDLLAHTGATPMHGRDQAVLRNELSKWSYLAGHTHLATEKRLRRREEALAQSMLSCLLRGEVEVASRPLKSERAMRSALEFIHDECLGEATVTRVCEVAGCSISTLEYSFNKRFGTTPKQYMKSLQLSRVRNGLTRFDELGFESITDVATRHGFWHMGQFAADYRKLFCELPSQTVVGCRTRSR
jgi:AraC-like DNA-binding protein